MSEAVVKESSGNAKLTDVALFSCMVVSTVLASILSEPTVTWMAGLAFGGLLLKSRGEWLRKSSGLLGLAFLGMALALANMDARPLSMLATESLGYLDVVIFLIAIAMLGRPLARANLNAKVGTLMKSIPSNQYLRVITLGNFALSPVLSIGTVALIGSMVKAADSIKSEKIAVAATRGVIAAMLISPTFAPVGLVMKAFPSVTWVQAALVMAPLATGILMMTLAAEKERIDLDFGERSAVTPVYHLWAPMALMAFSLIFLHDVFDLSITLSIGIAALAGHCSWIVIAERWSFSRWCLEFGKDLRSSWNRLSGESLLFVSSGAISTVLAGSLWKPHIANAVLGMGIPNWGWLSGIIMVAPLIAAFGIHPIVCFSLLSPLITSELLGIHDVILYGAWCAYWALALIISPVSVLNMTASTSYGVSPWSISYRANIAYFIGVAFVCCIYLGLIERGFL